MKNVHILPTDKPSRLHYYSFDELGLSKEYLPWKQGRNTYITNDEEIKEGDWCLSTDKNFVIKMVNLPAFACDKKIILTTDPDLIKDGIQAIDDEFLEWFVRNPSCEYVEVKKESEFYRSGPLDLLGHSIITYKINIPEKITRCCGRCNGVDDLCYSDMTCDNHKERGCEICYGKRIEYKIIIPKEESKLFKNMLPLTKVDWEKFKKNPIPNKKEKPKQETLVQIANRKLMSNDWLNGVEFGAKWQQEQDKNKYSEEEVFNLCREFAIFVQRNRPSYKKQQEWFEQFKKQ